MDREKVFEAVRQIGCALKHVVTEFKADREIVFETVKQHGYALKHAALQLKADRWFMPKAA